MGSDERTAPAREMLRELIRLGERYAREWDMGPAEIMGVLESCKLMVGKQILAAMEHEGTDGA